MRIGAIIQARMGSTRLPGKVLLTLQDRSVLGHVIYRVQQVSNVDKIIIATTTLEADVSIVKEAESCNASCYRGSEQDVLSRYYEAALHSKLDIIVRITSDCPVIDPVIIESVVALLIREKADYASNVVMRSFPRGLDVEAFTFDVLKEAYEKALLLSQREHVTPYIHQNPGRYRIVDYIHDMDYSRYRWTLDTLEDWELIQEIYNHLYNPNQLFTWHDIISLMERKPELPQINMAVEQKKH